MIKSKLLCSLFLLLPLTVFATEQNVEADLAGQDEMTAQATLRDNMICANFGMRQTNVIAYDVTKGQPFGNVKNVKSNNTDCIVIQAGRQKSTQVRDWVKKSLNDDLIGWKSKHMARTRITQGGGDTLPEQLNFAVKLDLEIDYPNGNKIDKLSCPGVILAQGNSGAYNNWWFATNHENVFVEAPNNVKFKCKDSSNQTRFMYVSDGIYGGTSSFYFADKPVN